MARAGIDVQIMRALTEYTEEIAAEIKAEGKKLGRRARDKLKKTSPKRTGVYAGGWTIKEYKERGSFRLVIHNKDRYMLTSILEHGFRHKPDNKLVSGQEHIRPVQDELNADFEAAVEKIIKQ